MKRFFVLIPGLVALSACIPPGAVREPLPPSTPAQAPRSQAPAPVRPAPIYVPAPQPAAPAATAPVVTSSAVAAAWVTAPLSPGGWIYQGGRGAPSRALWGPVSAPTFTVSCEPGRVVSLTRSGAVGGGITVRATSSSRTLPATAGPQGLRAQLTASDPLLDELAFSRGRFAVEAPGVPQLVIPAWAELARVIEDCRR